MPPAWSPEKHANHYVDHTEENAPEYITASVHLPQIEEKQTSNRDKYHIRWLLEKLPKLGEIFTLHRQIGEGTFSAVFMASLRNAERSRLFAIKHLVPTTHPKRIEVELSCLKIIGGVDNVVGLDLCMRENENIIFVMPYLEHNQFVDYVGDMDVKETTFFMKNLLKAVCRVHSFNIIHRDVKPNNFLYDRNNKKFLLIDFGLAQVCTSNSLSSFNSDNTEGFISQKRKQENETNFSKLSEPVPKRPALQKRNINSLNSTVFHLQNTLSSKNALNSSSNFSKENVCDEISIVKKSPMKSPLKKVSVNVMKSPYKFTGLNLPPTHSKLRGKMPGQKRLFAEFEEGPQAKFQKPAPSVSVSARIPTKDISPTQQKRQIHQNLQEDCKCYNKPSVCTVCLIRKAQDAPRAGTPGFRPPEVLLKHRQQTTAVDIWAVGVIMLSILSGTYPFFRAPDDVTALAEIITIFGDEKIKKVAKLLGRQLLCSEKKRGLDLRKICCRLRMRGKKVMNTSDKKCPFCEQFVHNCLCADVPTDKNMEDAFPDSAYDLLKRLLEVDPYRRISAEEALKHPFLNES